LTDAERAIVARLCAINELPVPSGVDLAALRVVGSCECGCASVDFRPGPFTGQIIGEGYGVTVSGIDVGLILWGSENGLAALEIYMLGMEDTPELPRPESLHRGEGAPAS
jgi:hypothetical protein